MNKLLAYLLMLTVLSSSAYAIVLNASTVQFGSHFNLNANDNAHGLFNGSIHANNTLGFNNTANESFIFNGGSDHLNYSANSALSPSSFSVSLWVRPEETGDYTLLSKHNPTSKTGWTIFHLDASNSLYFQASTGAAWANIAIDTAWDNINTIYHLVYTYNATDGAIKFYSNNTLADSATTTSGGIAADTTTNFTIGKNPQAANYDYAGKIDEVLIFNKSLSAAEVALLYAAYNDWSLNISGGGGGAVSAVNVTILTPQNATYNMSNFSALMVCNGDNATYKMNIFIDSLLPAIRTVNNDSQQTKDFNYTDGYHNLTVICNYTDASGIVHNGSAFQTFGIDTATPQVSTNFNTSFLLSPFSNLTAQFNLTDNLLLYSYNLTINGVQMSYFNQMNRSNYSVNFSRSVADLIPGRQQLRMRVADAHTKRQIPDYTIDQGSHKDYIKYIFDDGLTAKISLVGGGINDKFNTSKEYDRYNWTFYPNLPASEYVFEVKTDSDIYTVDDGTTKWLVFDDKWIDFNLLNEAEQVSIEYKSPSRVWVTVSNISNPMEQLYQSIGELNIVEYNYTFYTINATLSYSPLVFRGESTTISLALNMTNLSLYNQTADLFYNWSSIGGGNYTASGQNYAVFAKTFLVTSPYDNETFSYHFNTTNFSGNFYVNGTHTIIDFDLTTNCSQENNVTTLNLTVYHEDYPALQLNATVMIDSTFWLTSRNNSRNFTINLSHDSSYILCLAANGTTGNYTVYSDMIVFNSVPGGFTHRNYYFNLSLNENVTNISLYNFNYTTGVSQLRITTRDQDDYSYFKDAVVSFERRYVDEGIWRTVQMGLTDDFGNAVFDILEKTVDYRLTFRDTDNHVLYQSSRILFSCDFSVCSLIFKLNEWSDAVINPNLQIVRTYDNATKMLTISWSDSTYLTKSVWVQVKRPTSDVELCSQTVNAASGTINCNLSLYTGDVLVNVYAEDLIPQFSEMLHLAQQFFSSLSSLPRTERALWTGGIMITIGIAGVAFGAAIGVVMTVVGAAMLAFLGMFNAFTITLLLIMAAMAIAIGINVRR